MNDTPHTKGLCKEELLPIPCMAQLLGLVKNFCFDGSWFDYPMSVYELLAAESNRLYCRFFRKCTVLCVLRFVNNVKENCREQGSLSVLAVAC